MKIKSFFIISVFIVAGLVSCKQNTNQNTNGKEISKTAAKIELKDYGPHPTTLDIDEYTLGNENFRTTLWTGNNLQVTLMSIPVNGEVGLEIHQDIDQFLRIEEGKGRVMMGDTEDSLSFVQEVEDDFAIFVPAGKWHNLINTGEKPLKLYSIYSPPEHPHGTIHHTYQEAMDAEHH